MKISTTETESCLTFEEVTIRKPSIGDFEYAERIAGKTTGIAYLSALLSRIATFDGHKLTSDDIFKFSPDTFVELSKALAVVADETERKGASNVS